jgi:predicted SnoaL-like aldol condensation-catalyzing enzyme
MARTEAEQAVHDRVLAMYREVLIAMDSTAVDRYIAPDYIQHSSLAEPGVPALKAFLDRVRAESPDARQTIHRSFVDGDHVVVHTHVERWPGDPGLAGAGGSRCRRTDRIPRWLRGEANPVVLPRNGQAFRLVSRTFTNVRYLLNVSNFFVSTSVRTYVLKLVSCLEAELVS